MEKARLNGAREAELLACLLACLLALARLCAPEREVESFSHISNNHSARPPRRLVLYPGN